MPRPALTRSRIVSAGVAVVNELGLAALDLRTVARRVNATATGVQRLIGTTELVDSVVTQIVASMPEVPQRGDRMRRLRLWATQTRAWLVGYPGLAGHLLENRWDVEGALDRLEEVEALLGEADLRAGQSAMTAVSLYWLVLGSADLDASARVIGGANARSGGDGPHPRWPGLTAQLGDYSPAATAAQFGFTLDLFLEAVDGRSAKGVAPAPRTVGGRPAGRPGTPGGAARR